jgi:TadE-like protein
MKLRKQITHETRGAEIAEAAIVLPLMFMLLLGIYWFGRAYNIYGTITHAAREGARAATASTCPLCGNTALVESQIANRVAEVLQASHLDPNQATPLLPNPALKDCQTGAAATCGASPQICFMSNVQINQPTTGPVACGVSVSFQYPYQFYLPFTSLNQQLILLKANVQTTGED